ncbi:YkyB family protein [Aquibacillus sp. 3ASR75-11]|uniref:YkyB family protein n=2 Tax=Terrihalobacillus insolitus TaxID=2950438 RepID=A0A9X3WQ60_9BACI|nr:YkyB family protein [Terrihalobacillus insolitus]MDC3423770.1 YkyB family protein [Terrihalobacillus insolitus]
MAIFTVNRHAKTAPNPKALYTLKKETIYKLLKENRAKKIGLHFTEQPKLSHQHSTLLIQIEDYFFHIPPSKEDFKTVQHLGKIDQHYRNPKTKMSLSYAKKVLYHYLDWKEEKSNPSSKHRRFASYYTPSSLGKMDWPNNKNGFRK